MEGEEDKGGEMRSLGHVQHAGVLKTLPAADHVPNAFHFKSSPQHFFMHYAKDAIDLSNSQLKSKMFRITLKCNQLFQGGI